MQRQAQASFRIASAFSLALSCASCLVTNELDFEANTAPPIVKAFSPELVSAVPRIGSPSCGFDLKSLEFEASYYDEDVDQTLFVVPLVNGNPISQTLLATQGPNGSPYHVLNARVCVPLDRLERPCNTVQLIVTDDGDLLSKPDIAASKNEPSVAYLEWHLTGYGMPYVSASACGTDGGM